MDYTRNEDKLCYPGGRAFNRLISIEISDADDAEEPVTLYAVKQHLRVTFDDDDSYIFMLIKACRSAVEKYTGLSIVKKNIISYIDNSEGNFELPYGPIIGTPVIVDSNAETVDATYYGAAHKMIASPYSSELRVTYTAGFDKVPDDLKLAIMHEIAYQYEHRGDESDREGLSPIAKGYAKMHRRVSKVL